MSHPPHDTNTTTMLWAAGGSVGSLFSGLCAILAQYPASFYVSLIGVLGSILLPLFKLKNDSRISALSAENILLRQGLAKVEGDRDAFRDLAQALSRPVPSVVEVPRA